MKSVLLLLLLLLLLLSPACNNERGESSECIDLRERAYRAALDNQLNEGRALLAKAEASCGAASNYYIDRVQRVLDRVERHDARNEADNATGIQSPLAGFVQWIGRVREAKNKALGEHTCAQRGSERFGFCLSKVKAGESFYELEYFVEDAKAYRFTYALKAVVTCIDLGEHRDVSRFADAHQNRERCNLGSRSLRGLAALITRDDSGSVVTVYSPQYLALTPSLRDQLGP